MTGKRHDYFTSCLPYPQKGATGVSISLTGNAPVNGIAIQGGTAAQNNGGAGYTVWEYGDSASQNYATAWVESGGTNAIAIKSQSAAVAGASNTPQIFAELTGVSAVTVNALREAITLQQWYERDMRA